ncbi:hypothetical protein [Saccharothrix obliqua]|nr:hypothetical protein [Saccharothrix obliqua]MBW4722050.1 hypothetical protein [Saccharothrix obliqua]
MRDAPVRQWSSTAAEGLDAFATAVSDTATAYREQEARNSADFTRAYQV